MPDDRAEPSADHQREMQIRQRFRALTEEWELCILRRNTQRVVSTLSTKVEHVLKYLDPTGRDRQFQQIRVARDSTNNATFSIKTLHSYFHNLAMQPVGSALQEAWDAWEIYLRKLHEAR